MKRKAIQRRLTTAVMIATMAMGTAPAMAAASEGGEPGVSAPEGSAEGAEKADAQESAPAEGNTEKAENTEGTTEETTEEVTETPAEEPAEETPAEEEPAEEPAQEEEKQEEEKQEDDAEKSDAEETPAAPEEGETDETPETPAEAPAETTGGAGGGAAQEEQAETAVYTYTGKAISPALAEGEAFVGGETEAIAVGTYTARVAKDGAEYDLEWQIAPATLTVTPVYTVKIDDTGLVIDTKVMVDGFVGGEDADTAAGYTAPTVEQPATVDEAKAMKAYGGAAENYVFVYADSVESGQFRTDTYSDVSEKDYFATAVAWAETNNVANGVSGNRFAPKKDITREQMAVMLYRFAQYKGITLDGANETSFTDAAAISDYAKEAVAAMAKAGILSGRENGSFDPKAKATRAETASMLVRFAEKYIK